MQITQKKIKLKDLIKLSPHQKISIDDDTRLKVQKCRDYLDQKIKDGNTYYGINTGFGALHDVKISPEDTHTLQENLVKSHACGAGSRIPTDIIRYMLLLKIQNISLGHSAVSVEVLDRLIHLYNSEITPVIYEQGSLGASGDLAPLAHLALPLLGLGEVYHEGSIHTSLELKEKLGQPLSLKSKEGLGLLNGTQFMCAHALWALQKITQIKKASEHIAALSLDAYDCKLEPLDPKLHKVRNQKGQIKVAKKIKKLLKNSPNAAQEKTQTQDPYSFRCIPQVHGASYEVFDKASDVVEREINAVTDNPLVFPEHDEILSGGNFHGQVLALQLDFMAVALSELASISERRIFKMMSGARGLPEFLVDEPGLNSGLMIAQYTAASIVSQNKQLCTPASIDSIDSSNGQEDHVSMGANAATKLIKVVENTCTVLGIELMCASQAMYYRSAQTSPVLETLLQDFRKNIPLIEYDRVLHYDIVSASRFVKKYKF